MTSLEVTAPDGRTYTSDAPDGTLTKNADEPFGARVAHAGDRSTIGTFGFIQVRVPR